MTGETLTRLFVIVMSMNILLIVSGVSTFHSGGDTSAYPGDEINFTKVDLNSVNSTSQPGVLGWVGTIVGDNVPIFPHIMAMLSMVWIFADFILLGGVIGFFQSSGLPIEVQWIIGAPLVVIGIISTLVFFKELLRK